MKIVLVGQRHIASAQLERHGTASLVAHPFGMVKMDSRVDRYPEIRRLAVIDHSTLVEDEVEDDADDEVFIGGRDHCHIYKSLSQ